MYVALSNVKYADVAELADALASGASDRKVMWVQVPSSAPIIFDTHKGKSTGYKKCGLSSASIFKYPC